MSITKRVFGRNAQGETVTQYILTNATGAAIKVIDFGAILTSVTVPDRNGKLADVVTGFDDMEGYLKPHGSMGETIGRYGNRIAKGRFTIDGEKVEIRQPQNYAAFVWIPANKAILGGTGVAWGMHVWTADTQSAASRQQWRQTLSDMAALHPQQVIPGHYLGTPPAGDKAIVFTRDYLEKFEQALKAHKDSASVIKAMKAQYPGLAEESSLELSAKVNTGEMKW